MAVELMLNAVNLVLVTADTTVRAALPHTGAVFALFVIVLAAAEVGVGPGDRAAALPAAPLGPVDEVPLADEPARPRAGRRRAGHAPASEPPGDRHARRGPAARSRSSAALVGFLLPPPRPGVGRRRPRHRSARPPPWSSRSCSPRPVDGAGARRRRRVADFGDLPVTVGVRLDPAAALRRGRGRRGGAGRPGLLDRLPARRRPVRPVRRPGQPVHRRDAAGGGRRRPDHAAGRLGGHGHLLVPADRPRPPAARGARPPRSRRSWSPGSATSGSCSASRCSASVRAASASPTCWRPGALDADHDHGGLPAAARRGGRQERAVPAAHLAARRDGRPDPDLAP